MYSNKFSLIFASVWVVTKWAMKPSTKLTPFRVNCTHTYIYIDIHTHVLYLVKQAVQKHWPPRGCKQRPWTQNIKYFRWHFVPPPVAWTNKRVDILMLRCGQHTNGIHWKWRLKADAQLSFKSIGFKLQTFWVRMARAEFRNQWEIYTDGSVLKLGSRAKCQNLS